MYLAGPLIISSHPLALIEIFVIYSVLYIQVPVILKCLLNVGDFYVSVAGL